MDLDLLKKYFRGDLSPKEFLAIHREAGELLDLLQVHLQTGEYLVSVADWPAVRRPSRRQYLVLKTVMLLTPLVLVGSLVFMFRAPEVVLVTGLAWLGICAVAAGLQLLARLRAQKTREGRSALVVTNRRLMRIWLDGSGEVQFWRLGPDKPREPIEPVPETVRLLLQLDLGKTSLN